MSVVGRILLTDRDERFVEGVRSSIPIGPDIEVRPATSGASALDVALRGEADVVLLGPSISVTEALEIASEISVRQPHVAVILVAQRVTTDLLRQALRRGLRDVLAADEQTYEDVAQAIMTAHAENVARAEAAVQDAANPMVKLGKVITVFSTKGGVGKSVIATNLAVALARDKQMRVVIVDLDFDSSDVGVMLNLPPSHTIADAAMHIDKLDAAMLEGMLLDHSSGARALLAPARPEDAEIITVTKLLRIIELLRQVADVIVVDTPPYLSEAVLAALGISTRVLGVTTMEMTSVKNMRVAIGKFRTLGYRDDLVRLVINRADSKVLIEVDDIEKALGMRAYARIPSDKLVPRSINKGVPLVTEDPRNPLSKAIIELAGRLMVTENEE